MKSKKSKKRSIENDPSDQERLGIFRLCHLNVEVIVWPHNVGAEFYYAPDRESVPRIKIGLCTTDPQDIVNGLMHEALEFAASLHRTRYAKTGGCPGGDTYFFAMTHAEFTAVVYDASEFVAAVYPKLLKRWVPIQKKLLSQT